MTNAPRAADELVVGLPHSREAEEALIGAILINPDAYYDAAEIVRADDFYIHRLRFVWKAISELANAKMAIDFVTVSEQLDGMGVLAEIGGPAYLTELLERSPSSMNWESYARVVADKSTRRKLLEAANKIAKSAYNEGESALDGLAVARQAVDAVENALPVPVDGVKHISEFSATLLAEMKSGVSGFVMPTKLLGLDKITDGGLWKGRAYLLMAATKMRKTIMTSEAIIGMAENGHGCLFFSLEMPHRDFQIRSISTRARIPEHDIRNLTMNDEQWNAYEQWSNYMDGLPIYMTESKKWSLDAIRAEIRRHADKVSVVVVDYLGKVMDNPRMSEEHHQLEWKTRALKDMAAEFNVAMFAIHTLTNSGEMRAASIGYDVDHAMRLVKDKDFRRALPDDDPRKHDRRNDVVWLSEDFVRYGAPHKSQPFVADPHYPTVRDMAYL